jgi:hypothetical protein
VARNEKTTGVARVIKDFDASQQANRQFHEDCEKRYRSYRGYLEKRSIAAMWTSRMHPPYVNQIIEAIAAGMSDPVKFKVTPRPKFTNPEEALHMVRRAETVQRLLAYELDLDHFDEKYPVFIKQGLITGMTIGKTYWKMKRQKRYEMTTEQQDITDGEGMYVGSVPKYGERSHEELVVDDPCFVTVDVRDFFWPESATSVEDADYLIHRTWMTWDQVQQMEANGVWENTAKLNETGDYTQALDDREMTLFNTSRVKDRIEILEHWTENGVIVVGNRNVQLRNYKNPFWHGQKPFVVAAALPDLFQLPGMSVVELCAQLQEMLWTLQNQRLDALRLLSSPVFLLNSAIEDADEFEFAPGAKWMVDSVDQVKQLEIDPKTTSLTLEAEALLKGDMQNLTGGAPFLSGAQSQTIDQKTATGVSIVASLAQKMVESRKRNFHLALRSVGLQFVSMLQQFMRDERLIEIVGEGGDVKFLQASPQEIQGRFDVSVEVSNESLMRQEKRAEAQAKMTVSVQAAPVMAAAGTPLNLKAVYEDFLDAFDVPDKERYFVDPQSQPMLTGQKPGMPGQQNPQQIMDGQNNVGVTSPMATNPMSPSNSNSQSPAAAMQQMLATQGGANNGAS